MFLRKGASVEGLRMQVLRGFADLQPNLLDLNTRFEKKNRLSAMKEKGCHKGPLKLGLGYLIQRGCALSCTRVRGPPLTHATRCCDTRVATDFAGRAVVLP